MLYNQILLLTLVIFTLVCPLGCRVKKTAAQQQQTPELVKTEMPKIDNHGYSNDIERINTISEKINKACRGNYLVILASEGSPTAGNIVNIDYSVFDRLTDDGAAVLIAESIVAKSRPALAAQLQKQADILKDCLSADETAGVYVGRAGFKSDGFSEWLEVNKTFTSSSQQLNVSKKVRTEAFMKGFVSVNSKK